MNKHLLAGFSSILLVTSVMGTKLTEGSFRLFLSNEPVFVYPRVAIAIVFLAYGFSAYFRHDLVKLVMRCLGIALLSFGAISIISPTLFGSLNHFILPLDTLIAIESGICAMLASINLTPENSVNNPVFSLRRTIQTKQVKSTNYSSSSR